MRVVVDASAAIRIARRLGSFKSLQGYLENADSIDAPDLYIPEVTNAVWKYFQAGSLSRQLAEETLDASISIPDEFTPMRTLYQEALSLSVTGQRAAYDMFYLVLARRNNAVLVTADKKLSRFAESHDVKVFAPED